MRYYEFISKSITEGVGLARRKHGEVFKNSKGESLVFQELTFYPTRGNYGTPEQFNAAKETETKNKSIEWINSPGKNFLAFAIAKFKKEDGTDYLIGKYFKEIKANRNDNDFAHKDIPGDFKYNSKAGAKENAGYKPSEILTEFENLTPDRIVQAIKRKFGDNSDEGIAAELFLSSSNFPVTVPKGQMNFDAFKIYFCEMLQPIALVKGMKITGNLQDAVDNFFGPGTNLGNCTIKFNSGQGGILSDSVLEFPGSAQELRISTKDAVGGGAKASAQNFFKCMEEVEKTDDGKKILENNKTARSIIEAFRGNSSIDKNTGETKYDGRAHYSAPLDIAKLAGILTDEEVKQVYNLKDLNLELGDDPRGKGILSANLENFYSNYLEKWKKPVVPIHTIMLIIAYKVTKWVNEETNFSAQASEILNHSALIQVYTDVISNEENFIIKGMKAIYPSKAVTGVRLTTEKAYWTTGAQGNMTFEILYNNETSSASPTMPTSQEPTKVDTPDTPIVKITQPVVPEPNTVTTSTINQPDELAQIKNLAGITPTSVTTQTSANFTLPTIKPI